MNRTIHADGVVCQPSRNSSAKETESVTVSIDKGKPKDWTNKIQSERCGQSNPHRGGAKYADHRETALQGAQMISIDKGKPKDVNRTIHIEMSLRQEKYISGKKKNVSGSEKKCVRQKAISKWTLVAIKQRLPHTVKPSNKQFHQQADDGQCVHLSATEPTET